MDFQDGNHGSHLGFPIGTILATFDLQVTPMLPTKFQVNWHLGLGEEAKNRFTIGTILAIFDLHATPMLPSKFGDNWPFGSGEEAKNRFSRWLPWQPSWISDRNIFSYFSSTPRCFLASLESIGLLVQEMRKIDFQDGGHGGHLGFPIGKILAIFDLQVTPMLPSKFGVNWPFGSGEEAKNRFSRWQP